MLIGHWKIKWTTLAVCVLIALPSFSQIYEPTINDVEPSSAYIGLTYNDLLELSERLAHKNELTEGKLEASEKRFDVQEIYYRNQLEQERRRTKQIMLWSTASLALAVASVWVGAKIQ